MVGRRISVRRWRGLLLLAPLVWLSTIGVVHADDRFDIVGLRLGMTPEEVRQALRAHGVEEARIVEERRAFAYSDGMESFQTNDFVAKIVGGLRDFVGGKERADSFTVYFSPPPEGGRVVAIRRLIENQADPVTGDQFRDALVGKYGQPTERDASALRWLFGNGSKNCTGSYGYTEKASMVRAVYRSTGNRIFTDQFNNPKVKSLDECANTFQYMVRALSDHPAKWVEAVMVDVQGSVKAEQAANAWVAGLAAEAAARRKGQGKGPKL
jgi:hypothetical protein